LGTFTENGKMMFVSLFYIQTKEISPVGSGLAVDGFGNVFLSSQGLFAVSPIYPRSVRPYVKRYSLWTWLVNKDTTTAPVIGENRWLYLGYGTDIMALGD